MTSTNDAPRPPAVGQQAETGRHETEAERIDRNLAELLQELRVAGLGVQVLFGFLLAMPFTNAFSSLDPEQHRLYVTVLLLAALSTALLTAPVAYHRTVFRKHRKHDLLRAANVLALVGLVTVALAICGAILLVVSVVYDGLIAAVIAALAGGTYFFLWFVLPHLGHRDTDY
jgi:O-antigen/teichoic acid export membrane protein